MIANTLPQGLVDNPRLEQWIGFEQAGRVRIATGKVELGQGILTALVQIAADELDVAPGQIDITEAATNTSPAEGYTAGSLSIENSGGSIRLAAAEVRALSIAAAARRLACTAAALTIENGRVLRDGADTGLDYWQLAGDIDLTARATGTVPPKPPGARNIVGTDLPRIDLPGKIFGGTRPFIHDMTAPDLIHARVLRQPWPWAELQGPTYPEMAAIAGVDVIVIRIGTFLAVAADSELTVSRAAARLAAKVEWAGGRPYDAATGADDWITRQASLDATSHRGAEPVAAATQARITRTYSKPFIAHASIAPSCALARFADGQLTVWSHAQGPFPLRNSLARTLKLEPSQVTVAHVQGAGCYGHNGADDAACDAALIAREVPGRTVRVLWSRADELAAAPMGSGMVVTVSADVAANGLPSRWMTEIWSGTHLQRPGAFGGINLLAAEALPEPAQRPTPGELPDTSGHSGMRNAWLLYDVPQQTIVNHIAADIAPRTSSMRGLGAFANVLAIECFVDELAAEAGADPVAFRLAMTPDPRARAVIERAAAMAGWDAGAAKLEGRGRGFAYSRYKNRAGYLALVVDVTVAADVRIEKMWCAVDAGLVISPDGVHNQVEGGLIQAASWALKEAITFADGRVASTGWDSYPILKFSEVPAIEIALMDRPDAPTLGVGEVAHGPTGAAIANAVADALGVRVRSTPITRDRIIAAMNGTA